MLVNTLVYAVLVIKKHFLLSSGHFQTHHRRHQVTFNWLKKNSITVL